ncbi:MAG: OmpA family protein [Flavobacteriales bacterium]
MEKKAIFASNNLEGVGGWDLYSFDLHEAAKPERVFMLKGVVLDEKGQVINDLEIEIKNLKTKEIRKIKVENGNYATALTLAANDDVLITIKKEGYAFNSQYVSHKDTTYKSPAELDFELRDIVEGESFVLNSIYFDLDSYEINSVTEKIIIEFADYLKLNKSLMISINGYTDDIGEQNYNQKLSENRAFSVYNELISNGISSDRLEYKGFGESNPKNQNLSESERKLNRRTEFYVLKK